MSKTLKFYEENAESLVQRYDGADMSTFHQTMLKFLPSNGKVLDIGFGSGRDLAFLQSKGFDIFGVDPIQSFVDNARERFGSNQNVQIGSMLSLGLKEKFDAVISCAVWMHLEISEHQKAVESIAAVLKDEGVVILSFSLNGRAGDDRFFEVLSVDQVVDVFTENSFSVLDVDYKEDSLGRDEIQWATVVFQKQVL